MKHAYYSTYSCSVHHTWLIDSQISLVFKKNKSVDIQYDFLKIDVIPTFVGPRTYF